MSGRKTPTFFPEGPFFCVLQMKYLLECVYSNKPPSPWKLLVARLKIYWKLGFCETDFFISSHPEVFLGKGVLKICSKFTGEYPCRSVISIKLLCNFVEITFRHGCPPVNFLHIFKTFFPKIFFGWMLPFLHTLHATILSANKLWEEIISELG